jgi:hypothetical protein
MEEREKKSTANLMAPENLAKYTPTLFYSGRAGNLTFTTSAKINVVSSLCRKTCSDKQAITGVCFKKQQACALLFLFSWDRFPCVNSI